MLLFIKEIITSNLDTLLFLPFLAHTFFLI